MKTTFLFFAIALGYFGNTLLAQNETELLKGKLEDAKRQVDSNIKDPQKQNDPRTWYLASYVYTKMAKSEVYGHLEQYPEEKALTYIKESIRIDADRKMYSDQINVLLDLGPVFYNKGIKSYNAAVKDSVIKQFELAQQYFNGYFEVLLALKNEDKYVTQIIQYSGSNPNDVYFFSGYSAECTGKTEMALSYYQKIMDFNSDIPTALTKSKDLAFLYSAKILSKQKNYTEAIKVIERALVLYPQNEAIVIEAIAIYRDAEKTDDMIQQMEKVVEHNKTNLKILFILARNYTKFGKQFEKNGYQGTAELYYSKATNYYNLALDQKPSDKNTLHSIYYNLGVLYYNRAVYQYKRGDQADMNLMTQYFNLAKPNLTKAKELKPDASIDQMLAKITEIMGE